MFKLNVKLAIDLGNSETRIIVCFTDLQGQERKILSIIPCQYSDLTYKWETFEKMNELVKYTWDTSWVYEQSKKVVAGGLIADSMYSHDIQMPQPQRKKYKQKTTEWAFPIIYFRALNILSEVLEQPIEDLNVEWEVKVFLPAQDYIKGTEPITELITKIDNIHFVRPNLTKQIVVKDIEVLCEGFTAFTLCEDKNGLSLVIDLGSGTTDICLATNGYLNYNSLATINVASNNIAKRLKVLVENDYGIHALPAQRYKDIALTGIYTMANGKTYDFTKQLNEAIAEVSGRIVERLEDYLDQMNVSIDDIERVVFVGGGSIITKNEFSLPMAIREDLIDLFDNENIFSKLPKVQCEVYTPDHKFYTIDEVNPRLMNIIGAVKED